MDMKITLSKICSFILALVMLCPTLLSCSGGAKTSTESSTDAIDTTLGTSEGTDTGADTGDIPADIDKIQVLDLTLADGSYKILPSYTEDGISLKMTGDGIENAQSISYYISATGATEIVDGKAWLVTLTPSTSKVVVTSYASRKFGTASTLLGAACKVAEGEVELTIPYGAMKVSADNCSLAFLPSVKANGKVHSYQDDHPFTSSKYAETWLVADKHGNISYDGTFESKTIADWTKPKYTAQDVVLNAGIKEKTVEEAIVAITIAERKGATGFTLRLENLKDGGNLTKEALERITHSTKYPVMALYYDGDISQQARLDGLTLAAECGAAIVDLQGFMYHSGSTSATHTAQNKAYWENLGYNMSFVDCAPAETPISPASIDGQKKFIDKMHEMGCEVLVSTHGSTVYTAEQALAYAEFVADRGADIIKIVGKGQNAADVAECVRACKMMSESKKLEGKKFTYHLSGHSSSYITRVLTPTFYDTYIYFCYPELTEWQDANQLDLDMAAEAYKLKRPSDISIDDAITLLTKNITHDQLTKLVNNYKKAPDIVGYIYAVSSMMENKWTFSAGKWTVKLRESTNSNNYTTRSHVYDPSGDGASTISASFTGNYQPYVSGTRKPRVGVFFGNDERMLALVYNDDTKKIELCSMREGWQFRTSNKDPQKLDALVDTGLFSSESYSLTIGAGDTIKLGMQINGEVLELYYAKGNEALSKIGEVPMSSVSKYIPKSNVHAGGVSEIYMGSPSFKKSNTLTFSNVSYETIG